MDAHPGPRLSVKVAYYLTDLVEDSQGPTWVVVRPPLFLSPYLVLASSCVGTRLIVIGMGLG